MMGRLFFWLLMAALTYFSVKSFFGGRGRAKIPQKDNPEMDRPSWSEKDQVPEDMNKDPVCGTYVRAGSENFVVHNGEKIFFCSPECRRAFLESLVKESE